MEGKVDIISAVQARFNKDFAPIQEPQAIGDLSGNKTEVDMSFCDVPTISQSEQSIRKASDILAMSDDEWRSQDEERAKRVLEYEKIADVDLTKPIPRLEPVVYLGEIPICHKRYNSFIMGNPGAKKTTLAVNLAIAYLNGIDGFQGFRGNNAPRKRLLWFDTEQEPEDYSLIKLKLNRCAGLPEDVNDERIIVKGLIHWENPEELQTIVEDYIWYYRAGMVVLDGIVDLVFDPNNPTEAKDIIRRSRQWAHKYNSHILTIIHTNEGTEFARGHVGREAKRKYETAIICKVDETDKTLTRCSFQKTRRKAPDEFGLRYNEALGIGEYIPLGNASSDNTIKNTLPNAKKISVKDEADFISRLLMEGKVMDRADLIKRLMEFNPQAEDKTIANHISKHIKNGLIVDVGGYKYRLAERSLDE